MKRLGKALFYALCVWSMVDTAMQYPRALAMYAGVFVGALVWEALGRPAA